MIVHTTFTMISVGPHSVSLRKETDFLLVDLQRRKLTAKNFQRRKATGGKSVCFRRLHSVPGQRYGLTKKNAIEIE